jgi:hypothetical protein
MKNTARQLFLADVCPQLRSLMGCVLDCECSCEVVDFLRNRALSRVQAQDIAGQVKRPLEQTVYALNRLRALGILEQHVVLDWTFYSLTADTQILAALEQFWLVRDAWRLEWKQAAEVLHLL